MMLKLAALLLLTFERNGELEVKNKVSLGEEVTFSVVFEKLEELEKLDVVEGSKVVDNDEGNS